MKQYVLPLEKSIYDVSMDEYRIAIAIHLYYVDQMDDYISLVNEIPGCIDVYIISSDQDYLDGFAERCERDVYAELKENRGRDVSALLVHFAPKAHMYDYICFLHDKKESEGFLAEDVAFWNRNLQENTIGSAEYIRNIIGLFETNPKIGLIIPPAPLGQHYSTWLGEYPWESVFDKIINLKDRLNLNCNIDYDNPKVSFSGVLWFRYDALKRIVDYPWEYTDFPEEPLPATGTISHAIERIYPYVADDAGFETVNAMSTEYAADMLEILQNSMSEGMQLLKNGYGIHTISQFKTAIDRKRDLEEFCKDKKKIYIYGTGDYGKDLACFLKSELKVDIEGYVVSNGYKTESIIEEKPVYELREAELDKPESGVIISVKSQFLHQIMKTNLKDYYPNVSLYNYS